MQNDGMRPADPALPPIPWLLRSGWRLAVALAAVVAGALALPAILITTQIRQPLHAQAVQQNQHTAQLAARMVDAHFEGLRRYVESYSRRTVFLAAVANRDGAQTQRLLDELVRANPHFDRAFVSDPSGVLWVDYPVVPAVHGQSFAARDWFQGVSRQRATYVSAVYRRAAAPQAQVVAVAVPLRSRDDRVIGYLVGQHVVDTLVRWLSQLELAGSAHLVLVDQYGVLATSSAAPTRPTSLAKHPLVARALAGATGTEETNDPITAERMLISYAGVGASGWAVLAREPLERMYAPILAFQRSVYGVTALFVVVALALGLAAITVVRRYHRVLGDSEQRFRGLLDSAPDAVVITRPDGRIEIVNAQAERLFGYRRDELVGQTIELLIPERLRERHRQHRMGYVADPHARVMGAMLDLTARRKDGSEVSVGISLSPVHTKDGMLVFSDIRDLSRRKQTERELRTIEARFRALAETANDAIVLADGRGVMVYVNHAAERIFGYLAADLVGQPVTRLMPARFHADHRAGMQRVAAGGAPRVIGKTVELTGCRRNGDEFPVELSLASWTLGDETYFAGMLRDITRRKQTEHRIVELNRGLERRAAELEALNTELEAFSYSVSHDLRAPLRAIDGFSQALLEDYGPQIDAIGKDYLTRIRGGAQRMGHLIDDLLKLSRVTRAEVSERDVDLSALASEIAADVGRQHPQRDVEVVVAPDIKVHADPALMRIMLENLLANAWKFTGRMPHARIEFGCAPIDGERVFYVRDNGAGFDPSYAQKLFGAFQRLHDAQEFPGTGIGLATVQRIIAKHGGRVWAKGAPGAGATFYFTVAT